MKSQRAPEEKPPLLIVDDDEALRTQIRWHLADRFEVELAADRAEAIEALGRRPYPVVLLDLHLTPAGNDSGGLDVLRHISRYAPGTRVVLLSGDSDPRLARETLRWGAWDFCSKPMDLEKLGWILDRAAHLQEIEATGAAEVRFLQRFGGLATANSEMARVLRAARELAATRLPVLILGKAGSGKTALAYEILRARLPEDAVVESVPSGTLPPETPEAASGGWILEQVEGLSKAQQRRMEELFDPPAGAAPDAAAARMRSGWVLATSRVDLLQLSRRGRFRPDLARRLETARLEMPPLAARPEDHALLAREILALWSRQRGQAARRLTPEAEAAIPGLAAGLEVGGLKRLLEQAADRADSAWIGAEHLLLQRAQRSETLRARKARLEAAALREALAKSGGNITRAARDLGVSRPTLHDLLRKHELDPSEYRQG